MNPMHTVPTIDDNGFYLWESRAIMQYLVDQYGKDDSLSPSVPKLAAIVNQQLYFDACTLNARLYEYMLPIMMRSAKPNMEVHAKVEEALGVFDTILSKNKWAAGDNLTIADFALMSTVSTLEAIMFDIKKYPNVENWLNSCKRDVTHFEETIQKGSDWIHDYYLNKTKDY
ncbi:PREDICTED: glutathione S-transferase D1-like [Nicrophorus vespilloides]|uniref:Glutathione S-transferase D1-like n=1 Tax=Nicrophorus vespilloides TaxID=110193 RepID=A0ABM1ML55_NICVS|nr:PREDICTED: glutathione S-transferase D1-like [Nicrophorus vespilloides]